MVLIDAMPLVVSSLGPGATSSLKALFNEVRSALLSRREGGPKNLVILDDLASFEWIGIPMEDINRFIRALCALCRQVAHPLLAASAP